MRFGHENEEKKEPIMEKGVLVLQHFPLFPTIPSQVLFSVLLKFRIVGLRVITLRDILSFFFYRK